MVEREETEGKKRVSVLKFVFSLTVQKNKRDEKKDNWEADDWAREKKEECWTLVYH